MQKHVTYSPMHHFYAFDVFVDGVWLCFDKATELLSHAGFKPLLRGSFDECIAIDADRLNTTVLPMDGTR